MNNAKRLKPSELNKKCNPNVFKFASTAEIAPLDGIIGQDRAVRSLEFALDVPHQGYNIYLSGYFGMGKTTLVQKMLKEKASAESIPPDWCYVCNFKNMESPQAICLPAGLGKALRKDVSIQVEKAINNYIKTLDGDEHDYKKSQLAADFMSQTNTLYMRVEEEARNLGFTVNRTENGITSIPLKDGVALSQEEYINLSEDDRSALMKNSALVQARINEAFRQYKDLERAFREKLKSLEQETARLAMAPLFAELYHHYRSYRDVILYLEDMQQDLLDNMPLFAQDEDGSSATFFRMMNRKNLLRRYKINLIVDNSELTHAPVVFEDNPSYSNLFGQIEYESEFGTLSTDFTKIKPGAVHRANGGYLVLHMSELIKYPYVWNNIKRMLRSQEICVESISQMVGLSNAETMHPQKIPANIKTILIGEPIYYYILHAQDEDFPKLFKVKADFEMDMKRDRRHVQEYARFVSSVCHKQSLKHFTPDAVAAIVDYSGRMADSQDHLTAKFNELLEIIYEANTWAEYQKSELVSVQHVKKAENEKRYRSSMIEERIWQNIEKNLLLIDVESYKIGEINGLAVSDMGDHSFGRPIRITAKTFMGERGLVNIEREIRMSGNIHSKGVLTLNGYMGAQYAQDRPLSLTASLTFEQSYQGIEGDSASSAELYALISSLADIPIFQGIAVTGSVNQNGEVQPVGGVNEKIEGFYKVCKFRGLNGNQGVIIPMQNVRQLMLNDEIVTAVRQHQFNIWAVTHIDEGLEILTGIPAGRPTATDCQSNTVHGRVNDKLKKWSRLGRLPRTNTRSDSKVKKRSRG